MTLILYDFEVFKYDWLVVLYDVATNEKVVIVNDKRKMESFYRDHKKDIWIGYNSRQYDQFILKGILAGFNPYEISKHIIANGKNGNTYNRAMNSIQLYNYDVMTSELISLKTLEAFMGNDIRETDVPFDLPRKLTPPEIAQTIKYCEHDVEQLGQVFMKRKDDFDKHLALIKEFKLPIENISRTSAQLISVILKAKKTKLDDEFDIRLPDTIKLNKYKFIADWFINAADETAASLTHQYNSYQKTLEIGLSKRDIKKAEDFITAYENSSTYKELFRNEFYSRKLDVDVAGVNHTFAWGGVHAGIPQFIYECKEDEIMIMADVTSLYPSIMLQYDLQSRAINDKSIFKMIYDMNVEMKKNKDPRRPVYKLICNTTYGCMGDKHNLLYDKLHQNLVCVFGQCLLLDLIEKLEPYCKLIQSNTDGILILIKRKDFDKVDDIVYEWETRTRLSMEFDCFMKIAQKDVNNYVAIDMDGHYKSKGAYVKKLSALDNDLPIVNEAMINFIVHNKPVEETINECKELVKFQKVYKLSSSYKAAVHNGKTMTNKSYRVFASNDRSKGPLLKVKKNTDKVERFAGTPDSCFIVNEDIKTMGVPKELDRKWYINLAKDRLEQFGYRQSRQLSLFM